MPKGTKILMVDDDKMLIDLYKERLELAGYNVEISRDGEEGLAKIHTVKPDLVLLDIMMPKVNGYEALASIKSDPETKDIPVIILSALMRDVNKSKAVESGADDYIIKSEAMPADVIGKIEAVLKKYHKDVPPESPPVTSGSPPASETPSAPILVPPAPPVQKPAEIQFEPDNSNQKNAIPTSPSPSIGGNDLASMPNSNQNTQANAVPSVIPEQTPIISGPAATPTQTSQSKTSPLVVFFLILIVILILGSDIFFYMQYVTGK